MTRRRERESHEMTGMVTRTAAAMVRRAEAGDIDALIALRAMRDAIRQAIPAAARALTTGPYAYDYGIIGRELGMSRQAVRQMIERQQPVVAKTPENGGQ